MATELGHAAAEAAKLALKMGMAAAGAVVFMADLGEELPFVEPVLKTIKAIREKMNTVKRNKAELAALEERCTYITACVIAKHRRVPTSEMDVTPLQDCVDAVNAFVELCGVGNRRARFRQIFKASDDKDEIAELNARVDRLTGDLQLAGIVTVEGKIDGLKAFLSAKQDVLLANQENLQRRQEEFGMRLPKPPAKLAKVPKGTPVNKSWHVQRREVMGKVFEVLAEDGEPRLVGLVGDSGSGKTTAASDIVRSTEVRKIFHDGIVWLPINKGAKQRLSSLMMHLARMVYECIEGSVGRPPGVSDDGAAYIKQRMEEGHIGKGLKCLVVADNVWEKEVVLKLRETGMWVLLSTRDEELVKVVQGEAVGVHELSMADAKSVLTHAAELDPEEDLPDDAVDLIDMCGRVAMDLAFVGRWSTVRRRQYKEAWSDAAKTIRTEIDKVQAEPDSDGVESGHSKRRNAILRAGFEDLAVGSDDARVPRLYLSLAVMPDGHAFTAKDAAVLLCNLAPTAEDVKSIETVVETLERWTVVRFTEGAYHMHDGHSSFARESLMNRLDVRRPALERWVRFISSLDALRTIDAFVLKGLWLGVERVHVDGECWNNSCPYAAALDEMDESDPLLRQSLDAMGCFQGAQEDWEAASKTGRRLLEIEKTELGPDHMFVLNSLKALAYCADRLGHLEEAAEWRTSHREAIPLALARMRLNVDDGGVNGAAGGRRLHYLVADISSWAPGHQGEVEKLLRANLVTQEENLGKDHVTVSATLHSLGVCLHHAGQLDEAEELLRRCLEIERDKLGRADIRVATTLHELGVCVRNAGRLEEAEDALRRCLAIQEAKLGRDNAQIAYTLHELGVCVRSAGRLEEAEDLLRRCIANKEAKLGRDDVRVSYTLHELGLCARNAGRLKEAEELLRRCLVIRETKLVQDDVRVAYTLRELGVCVRSEGRLKEAEELLRHSLDILEAKLGRENVGVAITLHALGVCVHNAGRMEEAEELLKRCLVNWEAKMGRDDLGVATALHDLGVCVRNAGRPGEAEELMRRCLAIREAKLGREDVRVAYSLHELGVCLHNAGQLEEAEGLLKRCLAIGEAKLGQEDVVVATTLHVLGVCVRNAGRLEEAEGLLSRCLLIREENLGQDNIWVAYTLRELGVCLKNAGRLETAEELLRRCLVIGEAKLGREDMGVAASLHDLGACVRNAGKLEEAELILRRCMVIREAKLGRDHVRVASTLHELGVCVRNARRLEEAEDLLRRCLVIREAKLGRDHVLVSCTLRALGVCVHNAGRLQEAEKLLRRCLVIGEAKLGREGVGVATTLHVLGVCVRNAGRLDEAENVLRRCLVIWEVNLGREDVRFANTLHELGCIRLKFGTAEALSGN